MNLDDNNCEKPKSNCNSEEDNKKGNIIASAVFFIIFMVSTLPMAILFDNADEKKLAIKEAHTLDYKLEQTISNSIEANNSVNLANVVNIDFNKVCIYYSFSIFESKSSYVPPFAKCAEEFNEEIPKINFRYIVFLDEDGDAVKSLVLNKKYDILGNRSYMEYSKKDTLFRFKKVKGENEYHYELS
ncbi:MULTISPECIES: hypothetical protein [unclassified Clostridioides]|uniref:hypothetical protein n=1 Tax=unclassified Clostridioides TaxID=2635829 RepID=UPI001D108E2A|nr:hypothetical protein [Clostridioides sp. ES-S-0145-01]MCC0682335.1 hypothetical protein [Clostridioides sp. ES-S-0005-03]MCC0705492.1 hypothetical protein [Clostridioides sp. ES-S-0190-01]UDN63996.1 hypothetical protein IC758_20575 [Clostridioides sp. ES-W-0016-02]